MSKLFNLLVTAGLESDSSIQALKIDQALEYTNEAKELLSLMKQYQDGLITFAEWVDTTHCKLHAARMD